MPRRFAPRNDMQKHAPVRIGNYVLPRANSQFLRIRREKLLSVMSYRKEYGLPRRFAPRNDMLKTGRCARVQGRNDMQKVGRCARVQGRNDMQ